MEFKIEDIGIRRIRDVKTLIEKKYENGSDFEFRFETRSALDSVDFEQKMFNSQKPLAIKSTRFPNSKLVHLQHKKDGRAGWIIVRSTTNNDLYFALQNYQTGYQGYKSNNKLDRYRALYLAYEGLTREKEYKFTAVRNSISHIKLDNEKAIKVVSDLFGEDRINIQKRKHLKTLQKLHEELLLATESKMVAYLNTLAIDSKERIGNFIII